jgi:subtilisin family serine protease
LCCYFYLLRNPAWFSNYNSLVNLCAPGVHIWSTVSKEGVYGRPYGMNDYHSGTSMATPHVSGVIAKIWSQCPDCSHTQVEICLKSTSYAALGKVGGNYPAKYYYGFGLVQADAAYKCLQQAPTACC